MTGIFLGRRFRRDIVPLMQPYGDGSESITFGWLLEDGSGFWLLEDASGVWLLEEA